MSSLRSDDMAFDPEGNSNSDDSFEKQLEQQEREMQEQIRQHEQETAAANEAAEATAIPTPVSAPTVNMPASWQQVQIQVMKSPHHCY